ncbi:MAG: PA2779 family protein [Burkholderiaceae bacterium]
MHNAKRLIASSLILSCTLMSLPLRAYADIVPTDALVSADTAQQVGESRAKVNAFLGRDDVRQALVGQGVDAAAARARVDAMSDDEVSQLAGRIDQAPAGGEVLGILFTVFVILLVTDILGLTKVFPFTRSVR